MGLPTYSRLRKQAEFHAVRSDGRRSNCGPFILQFRPGDPGQAGRRCGIIASRRVGNAVVRNRGKRIFRELFRRHESLLPESGDLVVVLRSQFSQYSFAELEERFVRACSSLHPR